MITTPSMGLKRWDQPNDIFDYTELSDNFNLLDLHDHTTSKGVQIPTGGIVNGAITNAKLAANAVTATNITNSTITDGKLASPTATVRKTLFQWNAKIPAGLASGNYIATADGTLIANTSATNSHVPIMPLALSHYSVAGKTTNFVTAVTLVTNNVACGITITPNLFPITAAGSGTVAYTLNATTASAVAIASPTTSQVSFVTPTGVGPSANGQYGLGVALSGVPAANSQVHLTMLLQVYHT